MNTRCNKINLLTRLEHDTFKSSLSLCLLAASSPLIANPSGGQVVSGGVDIQYGSTTVVTQSTDKAIVNWNEFSVELNETTRFEQPSSSSVILNRVTGNNPSHILGTLSANGNVFLINPNGVVFGQHAVVDVGGLVASTASLSDQDFLDGNYHFTDAPAGSSVINHGSISVRDGGLAVLVAPEVQNFGLIQANLGKVALSSGTSFTVDLYGDNLITFDAGVLVEQGVVRNSGAIKANGGNVLMSVAAADQVLESLINMDGYIEATRVNTQQGVVALMGRDNSKIDITGQINASDGVIQVTANYIKLNSGAQLLTWGDAGGGTVHIGSDQYHHPADDPTLNTFGELTSLPTAQYVYMDSDALIESKDVVIWADKYAWVYGDIKGYNGRVETSGKEYLDVNGIRILANEWLLDPLNITVTNDTTNNGGFNGGDPNTFTGGSSPVSVSASAISDILQGDGVTGTDVIVTTQSDSLENGDITFSNNITAITWSTSNTLTFIADRNIEIATGGTAAIDSTGSGKITLRTDRNGDGTGTVIFTSGDIEINNGDIDLIYNPTVFGTPDDYSSDITINGTGSLNELMLIQDLTDLNTLSATSAMWDKNFALANTILGGGAGFDGIGSAATPYTGIFDGQGLTVVNLLIDDSDLDEYVGFFNRINGGTIRDLNLSGVDAIDTGATNGVGSLAGSITGNTFLEGDITIDNATVTGRNIVGGVIGIMTGNTRVSANIIVDTVDVTSDSSPDYVGGVVGGLVTSGSNDVGYWTGTITANTVTVDLTSALSATGGGGGVFGSMNWGHAGSAFILSGDVTTTDGVLGFSSGGNYGGFAGFVTGAVQIGATDGSTDFTLNNSSITKDGAAQNNAAGGFIGYLGTFSAGTDTTVADNAMYGTITMNTATFDASSTFSIDNLGGVFGEIDQVDGAANTGTFNADVFANDITSGVSGTGTGTAFAFHTAVISDSSGQTLNGDFTLTGTNTANIGFGNIGGFISSFADATWVGDISLSNMTLTGAFLGGLISMLGDSGDITTVSNPITINNISLNDDGFGVYYIGGLIGSVEGNVSSTMTGDINITGLDINLSVAPSSVTYASGLVGGAFTGTVPTLFDGDISVSGTIDSADATTGAPITYVGGLFGEYTYAVDPFIKAGGATITSDVDITLADDSGAGGIFGYLDASVTINDNLNNTGNITLSSTSANNAGGIAAFIDGVTFSGTLSNSGNINNSATNMIDEGTGGLFGYIVNSSLLGNLSNSGTITSADDSTSGLIGEVIGTVSITGTTLSNTGASVSGTSDTGGLFGLINTSSLTFSSTTLTNSSSVTGTGQVGGIFGRIISTNTLASNMTNTGTVTGRSQVGGIAGNLTSTTLSGTLTNRASVIGNTAGGNGSIGGIIGVMQSSATLSGSLIVGQSGGGAISIASAASNFATGYIVGYLNDSTISSSTVTVHNNVSFNTGAGSLFAGGIAGAASAGSSLSGLSAGTYTIPTVTATNTTAVGSVIGALIDSAAGPATFTSNLRSLANVTGAGYVGGVIGRVYDFLGANSISVNATWTTTHTASSTGNNVGGIVGGITGNVTINAAARFTNTAGSASGASNVGGLIGILSSATTLNQSYNNSTTAVVGTSNVGGLVGQLGAGAGLTDVMFGGSINAPAGDTVGGIVGLNSGTITNALSVGNIIGSANVGAVAGNNASTVTDSFYDTATFSVGIGTGTNSGTTGRTSINLQFASDFPGTWSFPAVWTQPGTANVSYVYLTWCGPGCAVALINPPAPTPTPTPTPGSTSSIITQQTTNAQNTNNPTSNTNQVKADEIAVRLYGNMTFNNLQNIISSIVGDFAGIDENFLTQIQITSFTEEEFNNMTPEEQQTAALETVKEVVETLQNLYCGGGSA